VLFKFWTIQGVWVFVTLLPTLLLNAERRDPPLGRQDYIGRYRSTVGYSDFHNLMGFTSKKMPNNILKNVFFLSFPIGKAVSCEFAFY
jgi:hypothetical protein